MPVTIKIAAHEASIVPETAHGDTHTPTPIEIVNHALVATGSDAQRHASFRLPPIRSHIQSSFPSTTTPNSPVLLPSSNGLIHTTTRAYNQHHHVTIRPDDIWMAIITQFSFYVNAHAEDLRGKFVAHEGKVSLEIVYDQGGSRFTVDMSDFTTQIAGLIERSVVDPDLRQWILPEFTTTTEDDTIAASIVMMGTLQAYFEYKMTITCGIPSVTLLGEKQDYEEILARVDKLSEYGEEPTQFRKGRSRASETICDYEGGSGVDYYSGWITAFCFWDDKGGRVPRWGDDESDQELEDESEGDDEPDQVDAKDIPGGFVTVPITINDNGVTIDGELLAGSVGIMCSSSGRLSLTHAVGDVYEDGIEVNPGMVVGLDTMQPRIGWFMYEKQDAYGPVYDEEAYMLQMLRDDPDGFLEYMENLGDSEDDTE